MMKKDLTIENGEESTSRNADEDHDDVSKKMGAAVSSSVSSSCHHNQQVTNENIAPITNIIVHRQILETSYAGKADSGIATVVALRARASDTSLSSGSDQKIARKPVGSSPANIFSNDFRTCLEGSPESSKDDTATTISGLASRQSIYTVIEDPFYNTDDIPAIGTSVRGNDHYEYKRNESILSCLDPNNNVRNQTTSAIPAEYGCSMDPEKNRATDTRSKPKPLVFSLEDRLLLFPPGTFSPNPVRKADSLLPASSGPLATNVNLNVPTALKTRRATASIPHIALQSVVEGSISRKPVNDAHTLDPSTVGLALSVYSDTQKFATFGPPENDDLSYLFHKFHLKHPSSAYPCTILGPGNAFHENVAHSTLGVDVNLTVEQRKRAENNKKKEVARSNAKADARAFNDVSGDGMIVDESSHNVSSESRDIDTNATYEIEDALRIRGPRMAHT